LPEPVDFIALCAMAARDGAAGPRVNDRHARDDETMRSSGSVERSGIEHDPRTRGDARYPSI